MRDLKKLLAILIEVREDNDDGSSYAYDLYEYEKRRRFIWEDVLWDIELMTQEDLDVLNTTHNIDVDLSELKEILNVE